VFLRQKVELRMILETIIQRYFETVDANGIEDILLLFDENAIYDRPGYPLICGRDELRVFYSNTRKIAAGEHTISDVIVQGRKAACRGRFKGLLRDGSSIDVYFADVYSFDPLRDVIIERTTFFYVPLV